MRTIKFRGQDFFTDKWVFGSLHKNEVGDLFILTDKGDKRVVSETVGQFTGLLDKNGEEIYEGDIIHLKGKEYDKDFGVVRWHENGYFYIDDSFGEFPKNRVKPAGDFFNSISTDFKGTQITVGGNIHDRPQILKKE